MGSANEIPELVRQFIFSYIDSVEQLEVLLLLRSRAGEKLTAESIAGELRSTSASVTIRLESLARLNLVEGSPQAGYQFVDANPELFTQLEEAYRVRRHKMLELIFSPMKKVRSFADAFMVKPPPKKDEDENG